MGEEVILQGCVYFLHPPWWKWGVSTSRVSSAVYVFMLSVGWMRNQSAHTPVLRLRRHWAVGKADRLESKVFPERSNGSSSSLGSPCTS